MSEALTNVFRRVAVPVGRGLGGIGVSPNAVTVAAGLLHVVVGGLVATGVIGLPVTGLAVLVLGFLDVVDGAIAKETGQVSAFGGFLDAWVDRLADSAVLAGLLVAWHAQGDSVGVVGAAVALAAFPQVAYTRAKAEAMGLECKVGLLTRTVRVLVLGAGLGVGLGSPAVWVLGVGSLATAAHRALHVRRALAERERAA